MPNDNLDKFREKTSRLVQQPAMGAWEKLAVKLDNPPKRKPIRRYALYAIAASFAVLFGLMINGRMISPNNKVDFLADAKAISAEGVSNTFRGEVKSVESVKSEERLQVPQNLYESFYQNVAEARRNGLLKRY